MVSGEQNPTIAFDPPARRALRRVWRALEGEPGPRGYWLTRFVFLRGLGCVYAVAFATAVFQLVPLVGEHGLLPAGLMLERVAEHHGSTVAGFWQLPTVFWLGHSDAALLGVAAAGLVLALAVAAGLTNAVAMLTLWALYMSIDHIGQRWYAFGWETQLLETGFLAACLCPLTGWRPLDPGRPPPRVVIVLLRWLVFRMMLGAGLIKLRGDPCWAELTCLDYHFETQPIPGPLSPLFHRLPTAILRVGVALNHVVEIVVPWFVFGPRRARHVAGVILIAFQVMLIFSGNLSFLNWLTILPCLACFDDGLLRRVLPRRLGAGLDPAARANRPSRIVSYVLAAVVAFLSLDVVMNLAGVRQQVMNRSYDRLHLVNTYGAFGSIGSTRYELAIEGTDAATPEDEARFREFAFKCKPGDVMRRPCLITPYHHRLDWLMWFAALEVGRDGGLRREAWVLHLVYKLLAGDRGVRKLMGDDPFPESPPTFVRVVVYHYRFADADSAAWWERERIGVLVPPLAVHDPNLLVFLRQQGWLDPTIPDPAQQ